MPETDRGQGQVCAAEGSEHLVRSRRSADHEVTQGLVEAFNHQARTPLAVILGNAELLADMEEELPPELSRSLAAMLRAGRRLNEVVVGICDLIEVAWLDPERAEAVDVGPLVARELTALRERTGHRDVQWVLTDAGSARCIADRRRLRRAVRELLENAGTHAPDRSTVRVDISTANDVVRIDVIDHGEGIDRADRVRLTRPFERGAPPGEPPAGRGMGLALASAVAASHGGQLSLTEPPGGGLRASLDLPVDCTACACCGHHEGAMP